MKRVPLFLLMIVILAGCTPLTSANLYKRVMKHLNLIKTTSTFKLPKNFDNTPIEYIDWVYIPEGEFLMGSSTSDLQSATDELPQHSVYLDAYWISKTEITNNLYNKCVAAGVCKYSVSDKTNPHFTDPAYANHPVVYINWKGAQAYCNWIGGRLPTEAEWEKAARGIDGNEYDWGTDLPSILYGNFNNLVGDTTPVNAFPKSASYYGVWDMDGNVREWVSDWYDPNYYQTSPYYEPQGPAKTGLKVLKGADYLDPLRFVRAANRLAHKPNSPGAVRGFRCAKSISSDLN